MPLRQMPNGQYVDLPDDINPDALKRIQAANTPSRSQRAPGQPRTQRTAAPVDPVQRDADIREKLGSGHGATDSLMNGLTFGFMDELGAAGTAATQGVYRAVRDRDIGQIGKTYTHTRDVERELSRRYDEANPVTSTVSEIGGALLNPIGTGARGVAAAGKVLSRVGAAKAGGAVSRVAARVARSGAVPQAIAAGVTQGTLNAAGHAKELSDVPGAVGEGALIGGATGGALGGAVHGARRGVQIISDASKSNAERTAFSRIAQLLENGGTNARKVQREIAVTDARGGDAMVGDMTPGLRAQAGAISRKPSVPSSNELIERGDQRITERRDRFGQAVRDTADVPTFDAMGRADDLASRRKSEGAADYAKGGVLDTPIEPTQELGHYLRDAPEEVQSAFRGAYREMLLRDEVPANFSPTPDGSMTHIPNLRTFDYVKRSFDQRIGQAIRSGDKQTAQGLSYQLDKLKGVLADANPNDAEYKAVLASQRDLFQQQKANELGTGVLSRMGSQPRVVLKELQALEPHQIPDARVGIIDALINSDNKADPVSAFRTIMRNDSQRKVMEFAFGGKGNLGRFERWVNREVRGQRSDVLTAPGRQSETARFAMADADANDTGAHAGNVLFNAFRGWGFGGTTGAISAGVRSLQNIATGTTKFGQEEIAKILLSKGENLVKGIDAAKAFQTTRKASNQRAGRLTAKGGQQIFTDATGD